MVTVEATTIKALPAYEEHPMSHTPHSCLAECVIKTLEMSNARRGVRCIFNGALLSQIPIGTKPKLDLQGL